MRIRTLRSIVGARRTSLMKLSTGKEGKPKSLEELGRKDESSKFLIACSQPYLQAISDDLKLIPNFAQRVFIISTPISDPELELCRIKSQSTGKSYADLKSFSYGQLGAQTHGGLFSGSMMSLNVQIGEDLLRNIDKHHFKREKKECGKQNPCQTLVLFLLVKIH